MHRAPLPGPAARVDARRLAAIGLAAAIVALGLSGCRAPAARSSAADLPNVVVILTDDQGWGDLGCFGHPTIRTPHIDALAAGGVRFTQFYMAAPLCSPSRAALLTGCYPKRVDMHRHVVFPEDDFGLHPDEQTLAEVLRDRGYATGCFGKWHLGHRAGLLPVDQGFDVFAGVPYSNDMAQHHRGERSGYRFRLPWMEGSRVVEWEPDQRELTRRQTDAAVEFIDGAGERPFLAYVPFSMPHVPIYASEEFAGQSLRGTYGDVIEEIDASVGRIVAALRRRGALEGTLIVFTSDNGPWLPYGLEGGSAGPLRGGKGSNWEGGQRVPFVAHWPRRIPAGSVCRTPASVMDLLPTIARAAGAALPERVIDGRDITPWLTGSSPDGSAPPFLYYTKNGALAGVRRGPWKLLLDGDQLFHLEHDVGEVHEASREHAALVSELRALAVELDADVEAGRRTRGTSARVLFDPARPGD